MISELGLERYSRTITKASERGQVSTTKPGQILLDTAIDKFSKTLEEWLVLAQTRPGPKHSCYQYLKQLKPEVIAFITAQIVIDNITLSIAIQSSALTIANALEEEVRYKEVKKKIPEDWKQLTRRYNYTHEGHKRKVIKAAVSRLDLEWKPWNVVDKYNVGFLLLELFAVTTGFIEIGYMNTGPKRRRTVVRVTNDLIKWYTDSNEDHKAKFPFYLPLVTLPEDWISPNEGGYPANIIMRWPLVHQYNKKARKQEYKEIPEVYDAVNALQKVPWRVNEFVWEVFNYYWTNGLAVADIPAANLQPLPNRPDDFKTNIVAKKQWKKQAHAIYNINARLGSKKTLYGKIHFIAKHYQHQDFWYPYKLDFRGRAYPIPAFLNPQGCPLAKGMLRFSEGKRISTDSARGWFYIHGANCWGVDKVSFEDRLQWVEDNEENIIKVYEDPISNRWWEDADSPWEFLAWCEEFGKWKEDPDILSYLPIGMDGTNNGLQIFSLLLKDPVGAASTNVSPADKPRDIYQEIADIVTINLREETDEKKQRLANNWLAFCSGKLPREATKRPVMVLPYGGTPYSIRLYVEDWYEEILYNKNLMLNRPFPDTFPHTKYLTDLILGAIAKVLVGAVQGMDWFRQVAAVCTENKTPLIWQTPTGFEIFQASLNYNSVNIRTQLGKIHRMRSVRIPNTNLSARGQKNGISPNFVHGFDAALMIKTTNRCVQEDIRALAMVHDRFATHADDCPKMASILREEVVKIFSIDQLKNFKEQIEKLIPGVILPDPPGMGVLDINCVLESKYFFA